MLITKKEKEIGLGHLGNSIVDDGGNFLERLLSRKPKMYWLSIIFKFVSYDVIVTVGFWQAASKMTEITFLA